ncbi:extracellular solute-binding protein [Halobellus marinus]|uniref:extracellular solute-binding protein n=1 Tax=Halobellus TaxID=1073986 RepID=UPI0028A62656|nr:extracellular solute-binding protein [Halobellus sp. DFY28]
MGDNSSPLSRRKVVKSLAAGSGIAALAGCSGGGGGGSTDGDSGSDGDSSGDGSTASSGGDKAVVRVSGGGGSWGESRRAAFFEPFANGEPPYEEEHNYKYITASSEQYTSELKRDPENPPSELVELDGQRAELLGQNDALIKQSDFDNYDDIPSAFKNEYMGGTVYFPRGIAYREDKTDKEFNTWDSLIDPDLEGKVGFEPWDNAGSKYFYVINKIKGGDLDNLEPGFEWLREFVETTDPVIFDQIDQARNLFLNDEMYVAPFLSARTENLEIEEDLPMGFSVPEGGSVQDYWGYPITKHTSEDRLEQAKILGNGNLAPETQAKFAEVMGYPPANPAASELISEETIENHPMMNPSEEQRERYDVGIDWLQVERQKQEDGQRFKEIIASA